MIKVLVIQVRASAQKKASLHYLNFFYIFFFFLLKKKKKTISIFQAKSYENKKKAA